MRQSTIHLLIEKHKDVYINPPIPRVRAVTYVLLHCNIVSNIPFCKIFLSFEFEHICSFSVVHLFLKVATPFQIFLLYIKVFVYPFLSFEFWAYLFLFCCSIVIESWVPKTLMKRSINIGPCSLQNSEHCHIPNFTQFLLLKKSKKWPLVASISSSLFW